MGLRIIRCFRRLLRRIYKRCFIDYDEELTKARTKKEKSLRWYYWIKSLFYVLLIILLILAIFKEYIKLPFLEYQIENLFDFMNY